MPEDNILVGILGDIKGEVNSAKVLYAQLGTKLDVVSGKVSEIEVDRRRSGDKYQDLIQRITRLEVQSTDCKRTVDATEERLDKAYTAVEDRLNEDVKGIESRVVTNVKEAETRLEKKFDEMNSDKKEWIKMIATIILSIVASLVVAHFTK